MCEQSPAQHLTGSLMERDHLIQRTSLQVLQASRYHGRFTINTLNTPGEDAPGIAALLAWLSPLWLSGRPPQRQ